MRWTTLAWFGMVCAALGVGAEKLTVERLVGSPDLDGETAKRVAISPDGQRVTFLQGKATDKERLDLWEIRMADGQRRLLVDSAVLEPEEVELDEAEKARRERQRIRSRGIVEYSFSEDGKALLFPLGGDLYVLPLGGEPRRLTATEMTETDARFSPSGGFVSFVRDQNLYLIDLETGEERALTEGGGGNVSWATAEFVAQEEMDRITGYWWSPDSRRIALTRIDEEPVPLINRYEIGSGGVTTIPQRYPFAGSNNARVEIHALDLDTGKLQKMDLGTNEDIYLARVDWHPDSKTLAVQRQSRDQKRLDLIFFAVESGQGRAILTEAADTWINLHSDFLFLDDGRFLWTSERSGFRHLFLYGADGRLQRQLTNGHWPIAQSARHGGGLRGVDEERGLVFFEASRESVLERHLLSVPLAGGEILRLTTEPGWHKTKVADDGRHFVDSFDAPQVPPRSSLRRMDGTLVTHVRENSLNEGHPYYPYLDGHLRRELGTLRADDGTTLHFWLLKPAGFDPENTYPAIVSSYGGPGAQTVAREWALGFNQLLAREGFVVFGLDNRGMGNRGKAFEDHLYRALGQVEVRDQVRGAEFLASQSFVDGDRIGFKGWSYGGYMAAMILSKAGDVFRAAVAGAPVTDWRLYDTHYTERYLGHPSEGDAYEDSSVFSALGGFQGNLLIIHGMADDNVVFDHSVRLIQALQKRNLPFEMMTYPGKRHGVTGEKERAHLLNAQLEFFKRHLKTVKEPR